MISVGPVSHIYVRLYTVFMYTFNDILYPCIHSTIYSIHIYIQLYSVFKYMDQSMASSFYISHCDQHCDSCWCCVYSHILSTTYTYTLLIYLDKEWRRPIGCLKVQVISRKRATNYRALLRKITYGDKASYGSWPPCILKHMESSFRISHCG